MISIADDIENCIRPRFLMATGKMSIGAGFVAQQRRVFGQHLVGLAMVPNPEIVLISCSHLSESLLPFTSSCRSFL